LATGPTLKPLSSTNNMAYNFQAALQSGLSPEEIKNYLISQGRGSEADTYFNQQQPKTPGIISKVVDEVKGSLNKRADNVSTALNSKQSKAEKVLQVGGLINDFIGTGAKAAVKTNLKIASKVTPDSIEKPLVDITKRGARMIIQSPEGQAGIKAIQTGVDGYNSWKNKDIIDFMGKVDRISQQCRCCALGGSLHNRS
jgi:hypothetical protein